MSTAGDASERSSGTRPPQATRSPRLAAARRIVGYAALPSIGLAAWVTSHAATFVYGTHNGLGFDRALIVGAGRITYVSVHDAAPFARSTRRFEDRRTAQVRSALSGLESMRVSSGGLPGVQWMSDPSRSPGLSGNGHQTLMLSGWALFFAATIPPIFLWLGRRRQHRTRGFDVLPAHGSSA